MEEYIKRLSIYQKPDLENVEEVTSAEYYYDPRCHLSTHEQLINDYETMNAFKGWIEDNKHLIKVRKIQNFTYSCSNISTNHSLRCI